MEHEEHLKNAEEIAKALGVSKALIRKKTRSGEIPHVRIGRAVRFDMVEVLTTLRAKQEQQNGIGND